VSILHLAWGSVLCESVSIHRPMHARAATQHLTVPRRVAGQMQLIYETNKMEVAVPRTRSRS